MRQQWTVCTPSLIGCVCATLYAMLAADKPEIWRGHNIQYTVTVTTPTPCAVDRVAQVEREFCSSYRNREGAFSLPSAIANSKFMEPSRWWSIYGKHVHVPLLAATATQVLSQPAAAYAAERNWSQCTGTVRVHH